ncbi:hypothetical protein ACP70R_036751 [Stipagrostis hirtigluma subsp. patula]
MAPWRRFFSSSSYAAAVAASEPAGPLAGGDARVSPDAYAGQEAEGEEEADEGRWSTLVPELLTDILRRVDAGAQWWPRRRDVVACACVCRRWREAAVALVRPPLECGRITFLSSLKQPGPQDAPIQCFIKRNRKNSTFYLYLCLTQSLTDQGKFLLAARRIRSGLRMEYIISVHSDDLSHRSHVGKLKSDLTRTKFTVYDRPSLYEVSKVPTSRASHLFVRKKLKHLVSTDSVEVGQVSYQYNLLKSRGPRKIQCTIQCPVHDGTSVDPAEGKQPSTCSSLVLSNRIPRWHEHLQCWCLNFHGRVMVASVKNFQLVAHPRSRWSWGVHDYDTVILQFGKFNDDLFTMDYRQPLSAFQAFAICLTSFGSKLACE